MRGPAASIARGVTWLFCLPFSAVCLTLFSLPAHKDVWYAAGVSPRASVKASHALRVVERRRMALICYLSCATAADGRGWRLYVAGVAGIAAPLARNGVPAVPSALPGRVWRGGGSACKRHLAPLRQQRISLRAPRLFFSTYFLLVRRTGGNGPLNSRLRCLGRLGLCNCISRSAFAQALPTVRLLLQRCGT